MFVCLCCAASAQTKCTPKCNTISIGTISLAFSYIFLLMFKHYVLLMAWVKEQSTTHKKKEKGEKNTTPERKGERETNRQWNKEWNAFLTASYKWWYCSSSLSFVVSAMWTINTGILFRFFFFSFCVFRSFHLNWSAHFDNIRSMIITLD